jgi:hypothetical protein
MDETILLQENYMNYFCKIILNLCHMDYEISEGGGDVSWIKISKATLNILWAVN